MPTVKIKESVKVDLTQEKRQDEEERPHPQGDEGNDPGGNFHFLLQRAEFLAHFLGQVGDLAKFGIHPGGKDNRFAGPGSHMGASKNDIRHFREGHPFLLKSGDAFSHRAGFACERGLITA